MTAQPYEYSGLMAQSWDLLRGDTSGWPDRPFYLELIRRYGEPVLDVGCGTGRLLLDYRAQGIEIDGVDNSPEMLALCQAKAARQGLTVQTYLQEMETLALPRHYQTILIPSSSFQLITDPVLADRALNRICQHLLPGGVLVAPFMTLWQAGQPLESEHEISAVRPEDGTLVKRIGRSVFDSGRECEDTEDIYQIWNGAKLIREERHQRAPATRSYTQAQARMLFERAGLVDIQVYQEFSFDPVRPTDRIFTLLGRRAV